MKLAAIQYPVFNPYNKPTLEIYVSGCTRNCKGCHTPELQDFNVGEELSIYDLSQYIYKHHDMIKAVSILGGDLLCHKEGDAVLLACIAIEFPEIEKWLFTGATLKEIPLWCYSYFDVIKYGAYIEELKQEGFPASSNQRVLYKGKDFRDGHLMKGIDKYE